MKTFDYFVAILLLILGFLILFSPLQKFMDIEQLIGVLCIVISGIMVRLFKLEEKNENKKTNRESTEK